ncbi:hypothetical protein ACWGKW_19695 [Streptomyces sp. NPDC054766]
MNWLITGLYGHERAERVALIRACAQGARPPAGPPEATALLDRHAPLAAAVTDFHERLRDESREIAYPQAAIERILASRTG